ncbi:CpsB/CapC family capsule biosynthesis tyrosine phosphatase [Bacillus sp. AFS053548]|uniref:CpsB/CapC family capsule biosynthesis tyrosine phosphatase n=1 Tax=Bacillus sp. AFS053548 TaxID=2033505 RepID=UPI000BFD5F41|nr:hypothetical protein CN946_10005 [Bacillus sp. AFS053548]
MQILVHPERNKVLINEPDILFEFVQKGILTQITAPSITGKFGKKIKKFAFKCIEAQNSKKRNFELNDTYKSSEKNWG